MATLFELLSTAYKNKEPHQIQPKTLELAIAHVAENLRAADYLFGRARLLETQQWAEEILAKIRVKFPRSRKYPDTIFATRSALTYTFCLHTERRGSINTDDLYLRIIPELIRQGDAQLVKKRGRLEVFAFRASDDPDTEDGESDRPISPISPISPGTHTYTHVHICSSKNNICVDVGGGGEIGEIGEFAPASPRELDLLGGYLALDLETYAEPKIARRGAPKITSSRDALDPFKGHIRLLTLADEHGNIRSIDFQNNPSGDPYINKILYKPELLPPEIRSALERSTLIIHNAAFDLLWLFVRLGIRPAKVFCTMTASRLLEPLRATSHSLGATLEQFGYHDTEGTRTL
jgi:3'-5' exonuclease